MTGTGGGFKESPEDTNKKERRYLLRVTTTEAGKPSFHIPRVKEKNFLLPYHVVRRGGRSLRRGALSINQRGKKGRVAFQRGGGSTESIALLTKRNTSTELKVVEGGKKKKKEGPEYSPQGGKSESERHEEREKREPDTIRKEN